MQDSKRDTVIKNRLLNSVGEGEGVGKGNTLTLLVGMQTNTAIMENSVEIS